MVLSGESDMSAIFGGATSLTSNPLSYDTVRDISTSSNSSVSGLSGVDLSSGGSVVRLSPGGDRDAYHTCLIVRNFHRPNMH